MKEELFYQSFVLNRYTFRCALTTLCCSKWHLAARCQMAKESVIWNWWQCQSVNKPSNYVFVTLSNICKTTLTWPIVMSEDKMASHPTSKWHAACFQVLRMATRWCLKQDGFHWKIKNGIFPKQGHFDHLNSQQNGFRSSANLALSIILLIFETPPLRLHTSTQWSEFEKHTRRRQLVHLSITFSECH